MTERAVVDASAMVDLLVGSTAGDAVRHRLRQHELHAPGHFDAEILSALGRLHRAGMLPADAVTARVEQVAAAPIQRHELAPLLVGAWGLRDRLRLVDALYVELASRLRAPLVTTDAGLAAAASVAELVEGPRGAR